MATHRQGVCWGPSPTECQSCTRHQVAEPARGWRTATLQHLMYAEDSLQDIFHSSYATVLPFSCFLLRTDLLFLGAGREEKGEKKGNP